MLYSFEIKNGNPLLKQLTEQGLSEETHPHCYNKIENISKLLEVSYLENKKGTISDLQLKEIVKEVKKTMETLI